MENRVQWCHGAPAAIPVFVEAYKAFDDENYLKAADLAADYTFQFGVLAKGMGLCHGTSSNIYMIAYLYTTTHIPKYKYYVNEMLKFSLDTPTLTDPEQFLNYDCIGTYSSFHDTPSSSLAFLSDLQTHLLEDDLEDVWMLGFGNVPSKHELSQSV